MPSYAMTALAMGAAFLAGFGSCAAVILRAMLPKKLPVKLGTYSAFLPNNKEPFCVFVIGSRVNNLWEFLKVAPKLKSIVPPNIMARKYPDAMTEEGGLLHSETFGGPFNIVTIQYWRSFEHLENWTRKSKKHSENRSTYIRDVMDSGAFGVWHETYIVQPGQYETVYDSMPPFLLGAAGTLIPGKGNKELRNMTSRRDSELHFAPREPTLTVANGAASEKKD